MPSSKKPAVKSAQKVKFVPKWEGEIQGYVVNSMRSNFFRVERSMTREDYMQEAYLVYLRVSTKYEVEEPQHLMALFKTAWSNALNDLSKKDTRLRAFVPPASFRSDDGEEVEYETVGEVDNEGELATKIRQAPRDVAMVMSLFLQAPQDLVDAALATHRYKAHASSRVSRLLGLDPSVDVLARVQEYFSPAYS